MSSADLPRLSLKKDASFRRLWRQGRSGKTDLLSLRWLPQRRPVIEIGIVTSKKVGNAVVRNRVRRRLREAMKRFSWPGCQIMIVVHSVAAQANFAQLLAALEKAAQKAGFF